MSASESSPHDASSSLERAEVRQVPLTLEEARVLQTIHLQTDDLEEKDRSVMQVLLKHGFLHPHRLTQDKPLVARYGLTPDGILALWNWREQNPLEKELLTEKKLGAKTFSLPYISKFGNQWTQFGVAGIIIFVTTIHLYSNDELILIMTAIIIGLESSRSKVVNLFRVFLGISLLAMLVVSRTATWSFPSFTQDEYITWLTLTGRIGGVVALISLVILVLRIRAGEFKRLSLDYLIRSTQKSQLSAKIRVQVVLFIIFILLLSITWTTAWGLLLGLMVVVASTSRKRNKSNIVRLVVMSLLLISTLPVVIDYTAEWIDSILPTFRFFMYSFLLVALYYLTVLKIIDGDLLGIEAQGQLRGEDHNSEKYTLTRVYSDLPPELSSLLREIDEFKLDAEEISSPEGYALRQLPQIAHESIITFRNIPVSAHAYEEARIEIEKQLKLIMHRLERAQEKQANESLIKIKEISRFLKDR